jgi:hypothetical protein
MKSTLVLACSLFLGTLSAFSEERSITVTLEDTLDQPKRDVHSPAAILAARDSGDAQALADISTGKLQIIYYGEPAPPEFEKLRDSETDIRSATRDGRSGTLARTAREV